MDELDLYRIGFGLSIVIALYVIYTTHKTREGLSNPVQFKLYQYANYKGGSITVGTQTGYAYGLVNLSLVKPGDIIWENASVEVINNTGGALPAINMVIEQMAPPVRNRLVQKIPVHGSITDTKAFFIQNKKSSIDLNNRAVQTVYTMRFELA